MTSMQITAIAFVSITSLAAIVAPFVLAFRRGRYPDIDAVFRPIWLGVGALAFFWVGFTGLRLIIGIANYGGQ